MSLMMMIIMAFGEEAECRWSEGNEGWIVEYGATDKQVECILVWNKNVTGTDWTDKTQHIIVTWSEFHTYRYSTDESLAQGLFFFNIILTLLEILPKRIIKIIVLSKILVSRKSVIQTLNSYQYIYILQSILKYYHLFWLITVVPFKIYLKSFPRSAFLFINTTSARLVSY